MGPTFISTQHQKSQRTSHFHWLIARPELTMSSTMSFQQLRKQLTKRTTPSPQVAQSLLFSLLQREERPIDSSRESLNRTTPQESTHHRIDLTCAVPSHLWALLRKTSIACTEKLATRILSGLVILLEMHCHLALAFHTLQRMDWLASLRRQHTSQPRQQT